MDIDGEIKERKLFRSMPVTREPATMYCYRCGKTVPVFRPSTEDMRRDPTLDDYIGEMYCVHCINDIVGASQ